MHKKLFALTLAAAANGVAAQSSVTIWGTLDADLAHYKLNGQSATILSSSGSSPSRLGFRGSEDLGGGLAAHFWLESSLQNDSGNPSGVTFGRRSTVSLSAPMGELRMGREMSASFWNNVVFDPFNGLGPGASTNVNKGSAGNGVASANPLTSFLISNAISYMYGFAPNAPAAVGRGFYAHVMHALGENVAGAPAVGKYTGGRVGYNNGSLNLALSMSSSTGPAAYGAVGSTKFKDIDLGASYKVGFGRLMARVGTNDTDVANTKHTFWSLGANIDVGNHYIPISYNTIKRDDAAGSGASQFAVGYVHRLSKRTSIYTAVSRLTNKNGGTFQFRGGNGGGNPGLAGGGSGTGYDIGIKTDF